MSALDRQEVIAVLDEHMVGQREVPNWDSYRETIANALMALSEAFPGFIQVRCTDMEDYARIYNEGFSEAQRQCEADVRTAGADALRAAAAEQRRLSADARTNNGQAEHEDFADWLEDRAKVFRSEAVTIGDAWHELTERWTVRDLVAYAMQNGDYCCQVGCGGGGCETCPCCCAGFCVSGLDFTNGRWPTEPEELRDWLEVAAEHNPVATAMRAVRPEAVVKAEALREAADAAPFRQATMPGSWHHWLRDRADALLSKGADQ